MVVLFAPHSPLLALFHSIQLLVDSLSLLLHPSATSQENEDGKAEVVDMDQVIAAAQVRHLPALAQACSVGPPMTPRPMTHDPWQWADP